MGVGMSAYFRKYPSMSCTSERHIPQARTWTSTSSGLMSGTGTSSRTRGLPYSCMRAAFIAAFLSERWVLQIHVSHGAWRRSANDCALVTKRSDSRLGNRNVLFNGAGACSDRTHDGSVENDGYSAAENDDLSRVALLNAEERLSRLRESRELRGPFIEDSGGGRLVDGEIDAA